jgi:hypothetical protein
MVVGPRRKLRLPEMDEKRKFLQADDVSRHKAANSKSVRGGFDRDGVATTMWCKLPTRVSNIL